MNTINRETILRKSIRLATPLVVMAMLFGAFFVTVLAAEGKTEVPGKIYELDQNSHYEFSDGKEHADSKDADTYGTFSISGEVSDVTTKNGIQEVSGSIPLISTIEALKTNGFQGFCYFAGL